MTEDQVNTLLKRTTRVYDLLMEKGDTEQARHILRMGSVLAELSLAVLNVTRSPIHCTYGHRQKGKIMQDAWIRHGICLDCEHLANDRYYEESQ